MSGQREEAIQTEGITIASLDHLVITCRDVEQTIAFYKQLGMTASEFTPKGSTVARRALQFGRQKINLHQQGREFEPKAAHPLPGSQDLCFVVEQSIKACQQSLQRAGIAVVEGPVMRTGAQGPILSIYVRDPDDNLIELSSYKDVENS